MIQGSESASSGNGDIVKKDRSAGLTMVCENGVDLISPSLAPLLDTIEVVLEDSGWCWDQGQ